MDILRYIMNEAKIIHHKLYEGNSESLWFFSRYSIYNKCKTCIILYILNIIY